MPVGLAGVVACEKDIETGNLDEKHGGAEDVAGRVRGDADGGDSVGGVIVDGLDHVEGVGVILLGVDERGGWVGRGISDTDAVLDEPGVNGLGGVCHEDPAAEVGLGQDVGERGGMVDVKTSYKLVGGTANIGYMSTVHGVMASKGAAGAAGAAGASGRWANQILYFDILIHMMMMMTDDDDTCRQASDLEAAGICLVVHSQNGSSDRQAPVCVNGICAMHLSPSPSRLPQALELDLIVPKGAW